MAGLEGHRQGHAHDVPMIEDASRNRMDNGPPQLRRPPSHGAQGHGQERQQGLAPHEFQKKPLGIKSISLNSSELVNLSIFALARALRPGCSRDSLAVFGVRIAAGDENVVRRSSREPEALVRLRGAWTPAPERAAAR
jgi:hypothetical protein